MRQVEILQGLNLFSPSLITEIMLKIGRVALQIFRGLSSLGEANLGKGKNLTIT
jgi:hypothetical protein